MNILIMVFYFIFAVTYLETYESPKNSKSVFLETPQDVFLGIAIHIS